MRGQTEKEKYLRGKGIWKMAKGDFPGFGLLIFLHQKSVYEVVLIK